MKTRVEKNDLESLVAVRESISLFNVEFAYSTTHTHTHTHTGNFIKEKLYIKYKEMKVDMFKKHGEKTCLFRHINFCA